jgi:monovalent cation:H+ antiporter, CPA1 family
MSGISGPEIERTPVYFIASGAVEVQLPARRIRLGSGEFFGEMALLSAGPRRADLAAGTYCLLMPRPRLA